MLSENRPLDRFEFQGDGFHSIVFKWYGIKGKQAVMCSRASYSKFRSKQQQVQSKATTKAR